MGSLRGRWQNAKKKCPDFNKLKIKSDLGPSLDKIEKLYAVIDKDATALSKKMKLLDTMAAEAKNTIKMYSKVATSDKLKNKPGIIGISDTLDELSRNKMLTLSKITFDNNGDVKKTETLWSRK